MALDIDSIMISFHIKDFDYFSQNDKMGVVNIGKHANSKLGRRHWSEMLQSPCERISFWHPIQLETAIHEDRGSMHISSRSPFHRS